jgi:hypothetical protein
VPDAHSQGRAFIAKHVKQVQAAPRPTGIRFADWRRKLK